jgi:hypothetical protein
MIVIVGEAEAAISRGTPLRSKATRNRRNIRNYGAVEERHKIYPPLVPPIATYRIECFDGITLLPNLRYKKSIDHFVFPIWPAESDWTPASAELFHRALALALALAAGRTKNKMRHPQ